MENHNHPKTKEGRMTAEDITLVLSQTMREVAERKVTTRYAMVISRLALALTKVMETADLRNRIEFLEQVLNQRK